MLRYDRQTKPGFVALYDIRPGNGAGLFLQPRSPHGAEDRHKTPDQTLESESHVDGLGHLSLSDGNHVSLNHV